MEGCSKFHQMGILEWIKKEESQLLSIPIKEIIKFEFLEALDLLILENDVINTPLNKKGQTLLHYATKRNSKEMFEILISKGADINATAIKYQTIIIFFLTKILHNI